MKVIVKEEEFIKDNTISDRQAINNALCMPSSVPDSFAIKPLKPSGVGIFKGDKMPVGWSCNDQLEIDAVYPIYTHEGDFVIGKNGKGLKLNENDWKEILWF
jgi:hypothetical protein